MHLGLRRGTVEIVDYDNQWPIKFEEEKQRLKSKLEDRLVAIEHVGSTSVPELPSKPIIDMLAAVTSFDDLDYFTRQLQDLGYEYMPDRMFEDRKFFPKGPRESRTHHLNLVIKDDPAQWTNILAFRDLLRANQDIRDRYASLKKELATIYKNNRRAYTEAKSDFISQTLLPK